MDRFIRTAIGIGFLLAGTGVFYYYVAFLPSREREQALQAREAANRAARERLAEAQHARELAAAREAKQAAEEAEQRADLERDRTKRKANFDTCLAETAERYQRAWAAQCQSITDERQAVAEVEYQMCLYLLENQRTFERPADCIKPQPKRATEACKLPTSTADALAAELNRGRQICQDRAELGLQ